MMPKEYEAWLAALQPGDQVVLVRPTASDSTILIMVVKRRTPSLIILGHLNRKVEEEVCRIRAKDGNEVGGGQDRYFVGSPHIEPITPVMERRLWMRQIERKARDLGSRLSRNVIIPPQHESGDVDELDRALGVLKQAMDAVDAAWATLRGDKE
jgi:hypothetical protein